MANASLATASRSSVAASTAAMYISIREMGIRFVVSSMRLGRSHQSRSKQCCHVNPVRAGNSSTVYRAKLRRQ